MKKLIIKSIGFYLNTLALISPGKAGRKGFELFCHPARSPLNAKQKDFLESGQHGTFDFDGIAIQTYRWGRGSKHLLMLHGWQSHTYRWRRYIDSLDKEEYTIHSLDAPGHGRSGGKFLSVPLYSQVIERYIDKIGSIHAVISHSVGGFSALYTFYRKPELSSTKLIILASPGEAKEFFEFYKNTLGLSARAERLVIDRFKELFQHTPDYYSASYFASHVKAEGLIIHDEEDAETSVDHARQIHRVWKNSKLWITKGFGHNLRSEEVVNAVNGFVSTQETVYRQNQLLNQ